MKRRYENGSSADSIGKADGTHRVLRAGIAIIAALLIVLTVAVRPTAFAAGKQDASRAVENRALESTLAPGQIDGVGSATVLVYLNGSDLESEAGEATADIAEMLKSGIGGNANVVIETLGTKEWQDYGIASDHTQRYIVNKGELELVDDSLGQLDTTDPATLADFISWGIENYPADRYILLFWDHGAGPVYGFGYDEFQSEDSALTLDEMKQALEANSNVHFDIIGMDCCIMGSMETCLVLQPYCDYMVVSEDFEPGIGWSYKGWMSMLEQNPGVDTVELGTVIVNDMISDVAADEENGDATLALVDESKVEELYDAWVAFAYANEDKLVNTNYSQETEWRDRPGVLEDGRAHGHEADLENGCGECLYGEDWERFWEDWDFDGSFVTMTDYFVTDIMEVASSIEGGESADLQAAFDNAMVHYNSTSGETGMSGLGVTLPYADGEFYDEMVKVFTACGIDNEYVSWLEAFVGTDSAVYGYNVDDRPGYDDPNGAGGWLGHEEDPYFEGWSEFEDHGYGHEAEHDFTSHGHEHGNHGPAENQPGWSLPRM